IYPRVHGQDFDELPTDEDIVSFFKELGHTGEIKSITDVVVDQMHQPWRTFATIINRSLSGKTTGLDKLPSPEEPTRKSIRVNRPAKKSSDGPTTGVVIRETLVKSLSKKKEKMTVEKRKGIDLLSEVALTEEAYATKIKSSITNEGTGVKPGVPDVTEEESTESESKSWGRDEDDSNNNRDSRSEGNSEHETDKNEMVSESNQEENEEDVEDDEEEKNDELVKTSSNSTDDEDETNIDDKTKGYEDEGMDYTTNQFDDDVNVRLNEPATTNEGLIQQEVITESLHVFTTVIPQSLPSFTPPPQQSTPTLPLINEATNPLSTLPNFASVFQFNNRVTTLEKEVAELKRNDPLNTQVTALVNEHVDSRLGATRDEFMSYLSALITARITKQVKSQLPQILPKEVSNFATLVIKSIVTESLEHAVLSKDSSQPKSTYEASATLTEFELKKILIDKMDESQSYQTATEHRECYDGLIKSYDLDKSLFSTYDKGYSLKRIRKEKDKDEDPSVGSDRGLKKRKTSKDAEPTKGLNAKESQFGSSKGAKSQSKSSRKSVRSEEPEFEVADSDMPQDQEKNLGNEDEKPKGKVASKRDWFTKPKRP
ncbi:hypothetical protein Tco_1332154, partial [Tanacetum coccineum]